MRLAARARERGRSWPRETDANLLRITRGLHNPAPAPPSRTPPPVPFRSFIGLSPRRGQPPVFISTCKELSSSSSAHLNSTTILGFLFLFLSLFLFYAADGATPSKLKNDTLQIRDGVSPDRIQISGYVGCIFVGMYQINNTISNNFPSRASLHGLTCHAVSTKPMTRDRDQIYICITRNSLQIQELNLDIK